MSVARLEVESHRVQPRLARHDGRVRSGACQYRVLLTDRHHRSYGTSLVGRAGSVYEGCRKQGGNWICDYKTRKQVSRDHYETKGHVARTFWKWKDYIKSQASCAGAISGLWAGAPRKGLLFFLDECNNGPM